MGWEWNCSVEEGTKSKESEVNDKSSPIPGFFHIHYHITSQKSQLLGKTNLVIKIVMAIMKIYVISLNQLQSCIFMDFGLAQSKVRAN